MKNAEWMIQNGYNFSDIDYKIDSYYYAFYLNGKGVGKAQGNDYIEAFKAWLDGEHKYPILDEAERRYLKAVIRPFKSKMEVITKVNNNYCEWIHFRLHNSAFDLPQFKPGEMYKGMTANREYSLWELGL